MDKSVEEIVNEAEKAVHRIVKNNIKSETCPVKKAKADWKREKVVSELITRLDKVSVIK